MDPIPVGKLAADDARRDAIHIAIAPVVAKTRLCPGDPVSLDTNGLAYSGALPGDHHDVGIVDPFLVDVVEEGQRFYLFLYPNTVTSLRHLWTHPAFAPKGPSARK